MPGVSAVMSGLSSGAVDDGFLSDAGVAASNSGGAERAICRSVAVDGEGDERLIRRHPMR